jgi:hypothetical protein
MRPRRRHDEDIVGLDDAVRYITRPCARTQAAQGHWARRVTDDLVRRGWKLERALTDNGSEFRSQVFGDAVRELPPRLHPSRASHQRRLGGTDVAHHPRGVLATRPSPGA